MAKAWVTEMALPAKDARGAAAAAAVPAITTQVVDFTSGEAKTADDFDPLTRVVRVVADTDCHILVGAAPTATTSDLRLTADQPEYFSVEAVAVSGGLKLSAIAAA